MEAKADPDSETKPPAAKRRRGEFDGVEVPTLAAVRAKQAVVMKKEEDKEQALLKKEEHKKLALLKNVRFIVTCAPRVM